jgi:dienelactone hydrolase
MLTRRTLLLAGAGALAARAQRVEYPEYARCLPDFLTELARDAYLRRTDAVARLTTPAAIQARQRWVRETLWQLVGGMPERTPLNQRTTGAFEREAYRVEKLVYESRPGLYVPANLYIPKSGAPPYPGVLFQMGHTLNGKAGDTYQKCCQGLARLGYVVLAFDPMGQGERTYYPKPDGVTTRLRSADEEHSLPGRQMLLVGDTATRLQVWDAVRSLDVLAAHPLVDPKRLASTGQSGGATLTMLLAAVDDRLAAAAVSSGNTENFACADFDPPGSVDDAEQDLVGSGPVAFDRWDLLYPLAPKPLLIIASAHDFFGTYSPRYLSNGREEFARLQKVYAALGNSEQVRWVETPTPHGLGYGLRCHIYAWFERWLKGRNVEALDEPPVKPERDETLWAGRTGNVVRDFGSKRPVILARERAAQFHPSVLSRAEIATLLRVDPNHAPTSRIAGRVRSEACDIVAIEVHPAPRVSAPAWVFAPRNADPSKPVLLVVEPRGRNARWREGDLYHQLAATGMVVCAADVRGIGDLVPEVGRGAQHYEIPHAREEAYAWASLILGAPLLGQRVADLLCFVNAFSELPETRGRHVVLAALGEMAAPAMFAAALHDRIERAYFSGALASYRSILDVDAYKQPFANFLPGILERTDLPQVAAAASPRRIVIAGAVDGAGALMDASRIYSEARNVEIRPEAAWNAQTLASL